MSPKAVSPAKARRDVALRRDRRLEEQARQNKRIRQLVTPEGAELNLRIATASERAGAFLLDAIIIVVTVIALVIAAAVLLSELDLDGWSIAWAAVGLVVFLLRTFYFTFFEVSRKASTPGKRLVGLRVAARDGGRLTANAVLARNFMRELEIFLPLQFLLSPSDDPVGGWVNLLGLLWCGVFLFFPLFNRDKLRVGDLIAGTIVIHSPKIKLMKDIVSVEPATEAAGQFAFTTQQVDAYGIHELHVLEDVLRHSTTDIKRNVAERIRTKINWSHLPSERDIDFLEAYYSALRRRLEQRMLFGDRKEDKFDN